MRALSNMSKVWFKFSKNINGEKLKFRWEQLPSRRFEEFLDFKMKYYVKHEVTHALAVVFSGIHKNSDALAEYREIISKLYKSPSYHTDICFVDDESEKIVGFNSLKLHRNGEIYKDTMQAKTAEVQRFYEILHNWNNLCPVPNILKRYGVIKYFDDAGCAIHPDYRGYRFTSEIVRLRHTVCKANNVPLTGAWITSTSTQNTTKHEGWDTIYEVSSEQLEVILGVKFPNASQMYVYKVKKIK